MVTTVRRPPAPFATTRHPQTGHQTISSALLLARVHILEVEPSPLPKVFPHTSIGLIYPSSITAHLSLETENIFNRSRQQQQNYRVPTLLEEKNSRSFPVQFQNFPGAFSHSSQPNIKHIWTAIVTKWLPNIIECNQCQYLL